MAQMIPYILPLLLGRTFDLDKMQVGIDIFPKSVISDPTVIQNPGTRNRYKLVDSTIAARDLLDVEGAFSLNVKAGVFKAGASGQYLADTYNKENTVEIAITSTYETVTEQIPADAKPFPLWSQFGDALGTHFVRSITYGGELVASVRLSSNNTRDRQKIKAAFEIGGRFEIFDLGVEVEGGYEKELTKSVESTQIKIYSSVPLSKAPNDMETLKETLDVFPDALKSFNGGRGVPLKMELWPLELLDSSRPARLRNRALEVELDTFEEKFDDLRNTKFAISDWMKVMSQSLTDDQEKKLGEFYQQVEQKIRVFSEVIGNLDMTKGLEQLKPAMDAYGENLAGTYYKKYLRLRKEIAKDQGAEWRRTRGNGATYVHWGKKSCSTFSETVGNGTAFGSHTYGGGAELLCLSTNQSLETGMKDTKDSAILREMSYKTSNGANSLIFCASCHLRSRGSVESFVGRTECPEEWEYIYDGQLMSGSLNTNSTRFICLDRQAEKDIKTSLYNPLMPNFASLRDSSRLDEEKHVMVLCVVCAK